MIGRFAARNFCTIPNKKVGFMGLGNMGFSMMKNLIKNGYKVTAYDISNDALELAEKLGATVAPDVKGATIDQDICFTMLPNTDIVHETRLGSGGIFENAREGCLVIDSSTISPIASKKMSEEGEKHGLRVVDAPVSGGVNGALNGTLTFMVGCKKEYFTE
jgi:3-hydroxyisobutyrate dehydrogenase-like beta-hydroxyacid dehydrogenase